MLRGVYERRFNSLTYLIERRKFGLIFYNNFVFRIKIGKQVESQDDCIKEVVPSATTDTEYNPYLHRKVEHPLT